MARQEFRINRRHFLEILLEAAAGGIIVGCGSKRTSKQAPSATTQIATPMPAVPTPTKEPTTVSASAQPSGPGTANTSTVPFTEAWPAWPPQGVLNPFSPNAINAGEYVNSPLAYWAQLKNAYIPMIAENWQTTANPGRAVGATVEIHIRKGAKWSDGSPITARDVKMSLELGYIFGYQVNGYIKSIETPDDSTVIVHQNNQPYNLFERQILTTHIYPYSLFGKYVPADVQELYRESQGTGAAADKASQKLSDLRKQLSSADITNYISSGPFNYDRHTSNEIVLKKNPYWWGAEHVPMATVHLLASTGNTQNYSYALSGRVDWVNTYAPPTVVDPYLKKPYNHIAAPDGNYGPGLFFNTSVKPFDDVRVRQAIAYIIDRQQTVNVAYPVGTSSVGAAVATPYPCGLPPVSYDRWLTAATKAKLQPYKKDWQKAAQLLEAAGLAKSGNTWTFQGRPFSLQVASPAAYTDWVAIAENVASQLSQFGIPAKAITVENNTYFSKAQAGDYPVSIQGIGATDLDPWYDYGAIMAVEGLTISASGKISRGKTTYNWGPEVEVPNLGKVNVVELWNRLVITNDEASLRDAVNKLALAVNATLPMIDLLYNKAYAFFYSTQRWTGWPDAKDPLWDPNITSFESHPAIFIRLGLLKPVR